MINYLIQVVLFQVLFLAVYDFFLQRETFFNWNRLYLLLTPILAFVIPFLKFESIQESVPTQYVEQLPTVFLNPEAMILQTVKIESSFNYLILGFYAGITLFSILFLIKLMKIIILIRTNEVIKNENFNLVLLTKNDSAYSFFNYIFIKKELLEKNELAIIQHEMVHSKQLHTLDLLFFEMLKIVMWFNPLIYLYQYRITLLHEYISDAEVVKETNKNDYFNTILSETFKVENIAFINQFFKNSFIKKRIVMITKRKSAEIKQLKYLLIVPLLTGMLLFSSFQNKTNELLSDNILFESELNASSEEIFSEKIIVSSIIQKNDSLKLGIDIPFDKVEIVPVFPGCEGTEEQKRICLKEKISEFVNSNFNNNLANSLNLKPGVKRIFVLFKIDNNGVVTSVQARAPHVKLEEEAIRVISSLPKMIPGNHEGEVVNVKYSLPIVFKIEGKSETEGAKTTINSTKKPIYMIDGNEINKEEMGEIAPNRIKSVNVLKGEVAIKKYGEKGKNGVIEVILK